MPVFVLLFFHHHLCPRHTIATLRDLPESDNEITGAVVTDCVLAILNCLLQNELMASPLPQLKAAITSTVPRPLALPAALTPDLIVGSRASDSSDWKCEAAPGSEPGLGVTETVILHPHGQSPGPAASRSPHHFFRRFEQQWSRLGNRPVASGHS